MTPLKNFIIFRNYLIIFGGKSNQFDLWSNPRTNLEEFLEKNAVHENLWKFYVRLILE